MFYKENFAECSYILEYSDISVTLDTYIHLGLRRIWYWGFIWND